MNDAAEQTLEEGTGWADMFRGIRGIYTVLLNVGISVHAMDIFVITTVMPDVVGELGGMRFYAWTTMLYMVGTIIGAASARYLRSIFGRRLGYVVGGLIFFVGALGCTVAPSMFILLVFRVISGFGGGLLMSQSMTLVNDLYTGRLRTRVLATVTTTWSIASVVGPLIGGIWGGIGWWRGAFLTLTVLTAMFIVAAWKVIPEAERGQRQSLPLLRLLLLGVSVMMVGTSGQYDEASLRLGFIVAGIVFMAATLRFDARAETGLFPRRVLSVFAPIGTAYWVFLLLSASYTPLTIFTPYALRQLYGLDPLWIGYVLTVFSLAWSLGSIGTAGWSVLWTRVACISGLVVTGISALAIALTLHGGSIWLMTVLMGTAGLGVGMTNVHVFSWALAAAERHEAQITASAAPAMRSVGIAYGSAIAGLIANAAGFASGTTPAIVGAALPWVYGFAAAAAFCGALAVMRMFALKPGVQV